jgi:hypothetical protein
VAKALVVAGLVGQIGKQVAQPAIAEPQPAVLTVAAEQDLGGGQADQFTVGQARLAARVAGPDTRPQQLVDGDLQCDDEVVETGAHEASLEVDDAQATPTLGGLASAVTTRHPHPDSESII